MIEWDKYWQDYSMSKAEKWLMQKRHIILNRYIDLVDVSEKRVIEMGCGYGSNIRLLNRMRKDIIPYAVDLSPVAIEKVKKEINNAYVSDVMKTPFDDDYFDVIYSAGLMEHFPDEAPFIKEMKRILKPSGIMITFVPARYSLWQVYQMLHFGKWQHGYEKAYTYSALKNVLEREGFEHLYISGIDPFSVPGFIMKIFNISFEPLIEHTPVRSGYTEIYTISRKMTA